MSFHQFSLVYLILSAEPLRFLTNHHDDDICKKILYLFGINTQFFMQIFYKMTGKRGIVEISLDDGPLLSPKKKRCPVCDSIEETRCPTCEQEGGEETPAVVEYF